jgi:hypothetical protein
MEHLRILCEKAITYDSVDDLLYIFKNFRKLVNLENDWNMYRDYSPKKVMEMFNAQIFTPFYISNADHLGRRILM